jgi:feruloyl esterase
MCRVAMTASPAQGSSIRFEVWLPEHDWNGRFYMVGNGGLAGAVEYGSLAWQIRLGNAVASTDTGHSSPDITWGGWALGHPERVKDYGYRALKITRDASLEAIRAYYGRAPTQRYFTGCSAGARQALMLAQRFPNDWDGILAGSGPHDLIGYFFNAAAIGKRWSEAPEGRVPEARLPDVQRASRSKCSLLPSGIPADPAQCQMHREALECSAGAGTSCLSSAQLDTLERIYWGTGRYPGFPSGNEAETGGGGSGWALWLTGREPNPPPLVGYSFAEPRAGYFARQFFANVVFGRADWTLAELDVEHDVARVENLDVAGESLRSVLGGKDGDLKAFRDGGGKLLMFFGWTDEVVSPKVALQFYREVVADTSAGGDPGGFYRLFMAPGMGHCVAAGPGANSFGQFANGAASPPLHDDPEHNIARALEAWVERGVAPERIVATRWKDNDPRSRVVDSTLPLCVFPRVAQYRGLGDRREAGSYDCRLPRQASRGGRSEP